jgi:hypothetical protein
MSARRHLKFYLKVAYKVVNTIRTGMKIERLREFHFGDSNASQEKAKKRSNVTDPLAPWLLAARVVQSGVHLSSLSAAAVNVRFLAFAVQIAIAVYWTWALL